MNAHVTVLMLILISKDGFLIDTYYPVRLADKSCLKVLLADLL